jgi:uncharacterized protein
MRIAAGLLAGLVCVVCTKGQLTHGTPSQTRKPDRTVANVEAGSLTAVAFTPDGNTLATAGDGKTIKLWEVESGKLIRTLTGHPGRIHSLAFGTDGTQLASAGADKLIKVWDVKTGQVISTLQGHTGEVLSVVFSPNTRTMASVGADGTLRYWTIPLPPIPPEEVAKIEAALPAKATVNPKKPRKLLVFWRADGILHKSGTAYANKAIELLAKKTGAFEADFSRDYEILDPQVLSKYDALVMNNTAHLAIPDEAKKKALLDYVRGGGGVVGIHAAIDTFKTWPEGAEVVGATFGGHPWIPTGKWAVKIEEPDHPVVRAFGGKGFIMNDEFYELDEPYTRADRRILMSLDLSDPATAGVTPLHRADRDFAVSWVKRYGKGRVFYGMFGHIGGPFQIPAVLQHYLDGIQYALGDLEADDTPKVVKK